MTITKKLFEAVREAIPNTTARTFSRDCGMSEGYYGCISSQNLPMSTNALIFLAEVLECRKELLRDMTPRRLTLIEDAQKMIAREIASRMQNINCDNLVVRRMIIGAVAKVASTHEHYKYIPPFIVA